jgi:pyrroline-5-carboxylate reductase
MADGSYPVIRIMPNTPVAVGYGVILYDTTENVTCEALSGFCNALSQAGLVDHLPEALMDAGSAVSGCGPAFVSMFLESLADGGVACGLPRDKAVQYAAQMMLGTAKMVLESGQHPGVLKDAVCSPGGSTIQGVRTLEQHGFRGAVIDAVIAAFEKNKEMGKA